MSVIEMACAIFAWLVLLPPVTNGAPIARPLEVAASIAFAIAVECVDEHVELACDWSTWASVLDVWGAFETGYRDIGGACAGVDVGIACDKPRAITCGPWMADCKRRRRTTGLDGEAFLALDMMLESVRACGARARAEHDEVIAFGLYAGGACEAYGVVRFRLRWVAKELGR